MRTYFVLVASTGNQIREKEHDTPCQHMEHKIKISVFNYFHHVAIHENFQFSLIHVKLIDFKTCDDNKKAPDMSTLSQHLPQWSIGQKSRS
jgi:hypothetical protein